jgi:hypothetical protein
MTIIVGLSAWALMSFPLLLLAGKVLGVTLRD